MYRRTGFFGVAYCLLYFLVLKLKISSKPF